MSQLQISLAGMFGLTAAVAGLVVLFQNLGVYWMLIIGSAIACFRGPTFTDLNPILLGIAYMATVLVFTCTLSLLHGRFSLPSLSALLYPASACLHRGLLERHGKCIAELLRENSGRGTP